MVRSGWECDVDWRWAERDECTADNHDHHCREQWVQSGSIPMSRWEGECRQRDRLMQWWHNSVHIVGMAVRWRKGLQWRRGWKRTNLWRPYAEFVMIFHLCMQINESAENSSCFGNQPECQKNGVMRCIPHEWLCDRHRDCDLGDDEKDCELLDPFSISIASPQGTATEECKDGTFR